MYIHVVDSACLHVMYIMCRGVAGESGVICSTDDFFIIEGRYI